MNNLLRGFVLALRRMLAVCCTYLLSAALLIASPAGSQGPMRLEVIPEFPPGPGPFPAMVLAPGQGYHMESPALSHVARALVDSGVAVFRFNWSYWSQTPRGKPSDGLSTELRDMQQVIAQARADSRVMSSSVSVGGKSLGSLVAWRALKADPALTGAVLLTPVCSQAISPMKPDQSIPAVNYPGIEQERRPLLFVLGDSDPLCDPKVLLRFAAEAEGGVRVSVVDGDHSFNSADLPPAQRDAALKQTLGAVSDAVARFAATLGSRAPAPYRAQASIDSVTLHPIFSSSFTCSEHWEGNLQALGDALGADCVVQDMVNEDGRLWMRSHRGDGRRNDDWFGWRADVLSPCNCEVVKVTINPIVNEPGVLGKPPASAIFLRRTDGVNIVLAHVSEATVHAGDIATAGQVVAKVGNNGMARHPHVHVGAWRGAEPLQVRFDLSAMGRLQK